MLRYFQYKPMEKPFKVSFFPQYITAQIVCGARARKLEKVACVLQAFVLSARVPFCASVTIHANPMVRGSIRV